MNPELERAICSTELDLPRTWLAQYRERPTSSNNTSTLSELAEIKRLAIAAKNQQLAVATWCLNQIATAQERFVAAFTNAKNRRFYACWLDLEKTEICLVHLRRHYADSGNLFGVSAILDSTARLQSLFPYRAFASPGLEVLEQICSICRTPIRLRSTCGHKLLEIYDGELCGRIVTEFRANHYALVDRPVQKYSVLFPQDGSKHNYALVDYVVRALKEPWSPWSYEIVKRTRPSSTIDPSRYRGMGRNALCACGSKAKFKKCCLEKLIEVYDHHDFRFPGGPAAGLELEIPRALVEGIDDMVSPKGGSASSAEEGLTAEVNIMSTGFNLNGIAFRPFGGSENASDEASREPG